MCGEVRPRAALVAAGAAAQDRHFCDGINLPPYACGLPTQRVDSVHELRAEKRQQGPGNDADDCDARANRPLPAAAASSPR